MGRFYFHIHGGETVIPDRAGVALCDLASAHRYAVKIIRDSMFYISNEPIWHGWNVKITDESGRCLLTVLYPGYQWIDRPQIWSVPRIEASDRNARRPLNSGAVLAGGA